VRLKLADKDFVTAGVVLGNDPCELSDADGVVFDCSIKKDSTERLRRFTRVDAHFRSLFGDVDCDDIDEFIEALSSLFLLGGTEFAKD
jgi:hypothetical protein